MKILKNKKLIILIVIVLLVLGLGIKIAVELLKSDDTPIYGNRTNEIEDYELEQENIDNMILDLKEFENVIEVTFNSSGRLIDIIITVKDETTLEDAKGYGDKTLEYFTEEEKGYYDIEFSIKSDNDESETYPIMGYKNKNIESIRW